MNSTNEQHKIYVAHFYHELISTFVLKIFYYNYSVVVLRESK